MTSEPRTLVELLRRRAEQRPDALALGFLADGEGDLRTFTYGQLDVEARRIAAGLAEQVAPGGRAVLAYEPGLDFVAAFFGCLYAGVIAVPVYPPMPPRQEAGAEQVARVVRDTTAEALLTSRALRGMLAAQPALAPGALDLAWTATDGTGPGRAEDWRDPGTPTDAVAFLQYTSGSTAAPKGVVLRHRTLLANQPAMAAALHVPPGAPVASWLPMYHDMGLIGTILYPLYSAAPCYLMSPLHFLQRPARWLELISRFEVAVSGGPNFGYELCTRRVSEGERAGLRLSSWRVAFTGAEPIRAETVRRFTAMFQSCGFRADALVGCYGLAESTLLVTGAGPAERTVLSADRGALERGILASRPAGGADTVSLVPSGRAAPGHRVSVVDPDTGRPRPDGEVGEIWVRGPSVAGGYWRRPAETAAAFEATPAGGGPPHLRTGDLGVLSDGLLYVTGRRSDLLVVRGRNVHPHDVEDTAASADPMLRRGGAVAFAVPAVDGEEVALLQELRPVDGDAAYDPADLRRAVREIRRAVLETQRLRLGTVYLVPARSAPKTSSGKVRRRATREALLDGAISVLYENRDCTEPPAPAARGGATWTPGVSGSG